MKCDDIPAGLDLCVFDFGVNAGTGRSAKYLQTMIGTVADGGIGPNTLRALGNYVEEVGVEGAIKNFQQARQEYYESLSTFETFGRGWTRRVDETTELALSMI
jgi:lysozyme family protein